MIALYVDLCRAGTHVPERTIGANDGMNGRKKGDIVLAKMHDAPWSDAEKCEGLIVLYVDPELEYKLIKEGGVLAYPYQLWGVDNNDRAIIDTNSQYRVDVDMFEGSPGLDINNNTAEPVAPTQNAQNAEYLVKDDLIHDPKPR